MNALRFPLCPPLCILRKEPIESKFPVTQAIARLLFVCNLCSYSHFSHPPYMRGAFAREYASCNVVIHGSSNMVLPVGHGPIQAQKFSSRL